MNKYTYILFNELGKTYTCLPNKEYDQFIFFSIYLSGDHYGINNFLAIKDVFDSLDFNQRSSPEVVQFKSRQWIDFYIYSQIT